MKYLNKYKDKRCDHRIYESIDWRPTLPEAIITIPVYDESWASFRLVLDSLSIGCHLHDVEVLILVNYKSTDPISVKNASQSIYNELAAYIKSNNVPNIQLYVEILELSSKKAGVGLARKLIMDGAYLRFLDANTNGLIVCLDADTLVQEGYLDSILQSFEKDPSFEAGTIDFAHDINSVSGSQRDAIIFYESHLRYFIGMQRHISLPSAYQTVGSAMAVRAFAYAKEGGMPIKQAGEDFYFLHKYTKTWNLRDISSTTVLPSSRVSQRVPFGTGKAILQYMSTETRRGKSYHPESFVLLGGFLRRIELILISEDEMEVSSEEHANTLIEFFESIGYTKEIDSIKNSTLDRLGRIKKWYNWFDAFRLMKYLHHMRDNDYPDMAIQDCLAYYFTLKMIDKPTSKIEQLQILRKEYSVKKEDYYYQWRADLISRLSNTSAS